MFSNKLNRLTFSLVALLLFPVLLLPAYLEMVDCVVAQVGSEIISLTDIRIIQAFGLGHEQVFQPPSADLRKCLEAAVDRKVVINLAPVTVTISDAETEEWMKQIRASFEPAEWERRLKEFGFEETDLLPYLREILVYQKIIAFRFGQSVEVSLKEIESYYQIVYRPQQEARGEKPLPMVQVLDELESSIRKEKMEKQVTLWIDNLRRQSDIRINEQCLGQNVPSRGK